MKAETGNPDPWPPGFRRIVFALICALNRRPGLWRRFGAMLRFWPSLSGALGCVARRDSVQQLLLRPKSFSNTSHEPKLVAGDFLIGMDPGPTYEADRTLLRTVLGRLNLTLQDDADREAAARIAALGQAGPSPFDLVDDYLLPVVFGALKPAYGAALEGVVAGSRGVEPDRAAEREYLHEIRHVAAQLFAGSLAPLEVQRRAEISAASLRNRIVRMTPELGMSWPKAAPYKALQRNAIGLAWVSHPVTVQAGALVFQELLARPEVYRLLRQEASNRGAALWTCGAFRHLVTTHVLELMRFRPVFPLLARDVPRDTEFETGAHPNPRCPAGGSVRVLSISALFDPKGLKDIADFKPGRDWGQEEAARYLMFGFGERQCPARSEAVSILTSALIGLLALPELTWADRGRARIRYDGAMVCRMRLRQKTG